MAKEKEGGPNWAQSRITPVNAGLISSAASQWFCIYRTI